MALLTSSASLGRGARATQAPAGRRQYSAQCPASRRQSMRRGHLLYDLADRSGRIDDGGLRLRLVPGTDIQWRRRSRATGGNHGAWRALRGARPRVP